MEELLSKAIFCIFALMLFLTMTSYADVDSPKKQMKEGTMAEEVVCRAGYELVIRTSGVPNCVKPSTEEKMKERGLGFTPIPITESNKEIQTVPASVSSILNFYITDPDLNIANKGIEIVPVRGLLEFTINGIAIEGPETMIETGPDTGQFYVKLQLPDSINGRPISQDDIVEIRYIDESDMSGEQRISTKSIPLGKTYAQLQTSGGGKTRIGHEFVVRIYEPDANLDSRDVNRISLSKFEYRGEGGIRTTLSNPVFDANASYMLETGENTGVFEVIIKIPRTIDGKTVHIGDWYEIRYVDQTTPSNTSEEIKIKGKIG